MENKKVYNINAMRPVLLAAHEQGNRRMIDKKFCAEHGVSEGYFKVYKKEHGDPSLRRFPPMLGEELPQASL